MTRVSRPFSLLATLAMTAAVALAAEGCAVMASGECADKASCVDSETGSTGDGNVAEAEGGDATVDAETGGDVTADVATGRDATMEGATGSDATVEADTGQADGPRDTGTVDVRVDAPMPDGCVSTGTEDCTNGIDDNCDGKIDCADPLCQPAFTCVPPVPAGWVGFAELWQAANPATRPGCETGYGGAPRDGQGGTLTAPAATCGCACRATGQVCTQAGTFFSQTDCAATCATVTPAADGSCTAVVGGTCGSEGSFSLATATPTGGMCTPFPSTVVTPVSWATSERLCPYNGPTDNPGGCATAGGSCVRAPAGAAGYGPGACVYSTADPPPTACPAGFTASPPLTFYATDTDTRGCATCTCSGTPSGGTGSCTATVNLYGNFPDVGCTGAHDTYDAGAPAACQCFGQLQCGANDQVILSNMPGFVQANYVVTPATCGSPGRPAPTGSAVPAGPTTVCCM